MASIDFEPEDYLDECSSESLIEELRSRVRPAPHQKRTDSEEKKRLVYLILELKEHHDKARLIKEIENLFY